MIILDTNVISELLRPSPAMQVVMWVDDHDSSELVTTSMTAAELFAGVAALPRGRRKESLAREVGHLLNDVFAGNVLPFDVASSRHYAQIVATATRRGRPMTPFDAQIAAICQQHDATLATRNVNDFRTTGLTIVNPWEAEPG